MAEMPEKTYGKYHLPAGTETEKYLAGRKNQMRALWVCSESHPWGDLFISLETVKTNSEQFNTPYEEELHRTIIHGILHLCGINDKGPGEREIMEAAENKALAMRKQ